MSSDDGGEKDVSMKNKSFSTKHVGLQCPLCMEPLDFDDRNFYPCTCQYQVCVLAHTSLLFTMFLAAADM